MLIRSLNGGSHGVRGCWGVKVCLSRRVHRIHRFGTGCSDVVECQVLWNLVVGFPGVGFEWVVRDISLGCTRVGGVATRHRRPPSRRPRHSTIQRRTVLERQRMRGQFVERVLVVTSSGLHRRRERVYTSEVCATRGRVHRSIIVWSWTSPWGARAGAEERVEGFTDSRWRDETGRPWARIAGRLGLRLVERAPGKCRI